MKQNSLLSLLCILLFGCLMPGRALTPVMVQNYEKAKSLPSVWVVNIPNENASTTLSTDTPYEGKQCAKLHYHFTDGVGQYLGVANQIKVLAPVHKLHFMVKGDNSGCGYGVYVADASGEVHKYRNADTMKIDFQGWKELVLDLDGGHESWGGDKNGKFDYPLTNITFEISTAGKAIESDLYFDAISMDSEKSVEETLGSQIDVTSPEYCADVKGDTKVTLSAPGFKSVTAKCWQAGDKFGSDSTIATATLDDKGNGSFVFPAEKYPHGPIIVRISGTIGTVSDTCYLQLYNTGGKAWNQGAPKTAPPADGMQLVYVDDFDTMPAISSNGAGATYSAHKPGGGDFSWPQPFADPSGAGNPFSQRDSYLRIRVDANKNTAGLISSLRNDGTGTGVLAKCPCYFECRFVAQSAIGTWPAFWLLTKGGGTGGPSCDELDIIEAYGGEGVKEPNGQFWYGVCTHRWGKQSEGGNSTAYQKFPQLAEIGGGAGWSYTPHIYGCKITPTDTIYYYDNVEVARHPTCDLSKTDPFFFMINNAVGGGWPVDLSRYNGTVDMYVDYVRVYQG